MRANDQHLKDQLRPWRQASWTAEAEAGPPAKKRKTAAKPYCPQLGTANYAFLIVLYRVRIGTCGEEFVALIVG